MVKRITRYGLFAILLLSKSVSAGWYVGGLYTFSIIDVGDTGAQFIDTEFANAGSFSPTFLSIRGGYDLHKYLGVELRAGTGISDGKRDTDLQRSLSVESIYGGYLKLQMGNKNINPYVLAGYSKQEIEGTTAGLSAKIDDDDVSYGIGIEGPLSESASFTLEYMQYFDKSIASISGISLGAIVRY